MWRQDGHRDVEDETGRKAEPAPPAPAVVPGSMAWASAVGNQAVARLASASSVAREAAEEEVEEEPEEATAEPAEAEEEEEELPE